MDHHDHRYPGSRRFAGCMGQHDPLQFADCDDGSDTLWCTDHGSVLAAIIEYRPAGGRIFIYYLDGGKNLSNRHIALWEKTNLEEYAEMGFQSLKRKALALSVRLLRYQPNRRRADRSAGKIINSLSG